MSPTPDRTRRAVNLDEAVALLGRTPATLDSWLRDLPEAWLTADEGVDTWSAVDVLGHLVHGERTDWLPRVQRLLEHGESLAFEPFDRAGQFSALQGRTAGDLLDDFATLRADSLRHLGAAGLTAGDLARTGRHPDFGVVTLGQLLATWVAHDLDHVTQIARVMARQYSDEVGPWREYLRIINGRPV